MKKYVIIIAIIIASVMSAFCQTADEQKTDSIVCDSSFVVRNIIGQDVYLGRGEWKIVTNPTTTEQVYKTYGVELDAGVYFVVMNGKEEKKIVVR